MKCGQPVEVPGLTLGTFDRVPCLRAAGHEPPCRPWCDAPEKTAADVGADEVPAVAPEPAKPSYLARMFLVGGR
jgi:hypothetical protein